MNEKQKFCGSGKGEVPLSIEETNRTNLIHTIFVELFRADLLKKTSKFYHLSAQRYLQNKLGIFSKI